MRSPQTRWIVGAMLSITGFVCGSALSQENSGSVPAPEPLRPRSQKETPFSQAANVGGTEITADRTEMDEKTGVITFTGNVKVKHPAFTLTGDKLIVYGNGVANPATAASASANDDEDSPPFKRAIATGAMVEIVRKTPDGKTQISKSQQADYDAATGDIVLSGGPPVLQSASRLIVPKKADGKIILRGNGKHEVDGPSKITFPAKKDAKPVASSFPGSVEALSNPPS